MTGAPDLGLGLILDWGGVLTTPVNESFGRFIADEDVDRAEFMSVMKRMHNEAGSPLHQVEVGDIDSTAFEAALASQFRNRQGLPVSPDGLLARMFRSAVPNQPVRAIVTAARTRGWRTAILSNAWGTDYDEEDLGSLVGALLLSDRIGVRKPDPAAYLHAAQVLGLEPSACVFVDDLRRNALGAAALGMDGFQYRPGTEAELEALLQTREDGLNAAVTPG